MLKEVKKIRSFKYMNDNVSLGFTLDEYNVHKFREFLLEAVKDVDEYIEELKKND